MPGISPDQLIEGAVIKKLPHIFLLLALLLISQPALADCLNAKSYGATGDGIANDAVSLQSGINDAIATSTPLCIPAGTYFTGSTVLTTPSIEGKLIILGSGKGVTLITRTNGVASTVFNIVLTGLSVVEIKDLTILGPTGLSFDNNAIGIFWQTATYITAGNRGHRLRVENVEIKGTLDHAILNSKGGTVEVIDSDLWATDVACAMFESQDVSDSAAFYARGGTWQTPDGDLSSGGSVGLYIHPHISYLVEGVTFKNLGRYGIYQNGSPGSHRKYADCVGCVFINAEFAQTKLTGVSNFIGCQQHGSNGYAFGTLGSSLGGTVNVTGCTFDRAGSVQYGAVGVSNVTFTGCLFQDTRMLSAGNTLGHWEIHSSKFKVTDSAPMAGGVYLRCVSGLTILDNVSFIDDTTTLAYTAFATIQGTNPVLRANHVYVKGGRGSAASFLSSNNSATVQIDDSTFDAGSQPAAIVFDTSFPAGGLTGSNNTFLNGAYVWIIDPNSQQRLTRRVGVNPTVLASAVSISTSTSLMCSYDTHVLTGSAVITNLTGTQVHVGILRFVVGPGASWSTASAGNIAPKTTDPRTPGTVVTFLWDGISGKWLEV